MTTTSMGSQNKCQEFRGDDDDDDVGVGMISCESHLELVLFLEFDGDQSR